MPSSRSAGRRLLVTGAEGLTGHALKRFAPGAVFAGRKECDLTHLAQVRRLLKETRPTHLIHLAAETGGVAANAARNGDFLTANLQMNVNVLSAARESGVERLVAMLCSCAFPPSSGRSLGEKDLHEGLPFEGNLGYGYSKRALDMQIRLLSEQYGCRFSTLTPVTLFGPNDNWDPVEGHVVSSLIRKCHKAKEEGRPFEIWGSGRAVRQFVYAFDAARLLMEALDVYRGPETVIVAADKGMTIRELAEAVAQDMNFKGRLVFDASKPEGQPFKQLQSVCFEKMFPKFKFIPFKMALAETVDWYLRNAAPKVIS